MARCDPSFVAVPYRTPSASPDRPSTHAKPGMAAVAVAQLVATLPQAAPPSPPLGPVSALAIFAAEMFVWLWFAPTSGGAGAGQVGSPEDGAGLARLQVKPTDRFLRFCHEVLSTSESFSVSSRRERGARGGWTRARFREGQRRLVAARCACDSLGSRKRHRLTVALHM